MNDVRAVVKVGGSLLDWPGLPAALTTYLEAQRSRANLVVIAGGGRAADWVRDLDRIHGLGDELSHDLALRSLDLAAQLLVALVPVLRIVTPARFFAGRGEKGSISLMNARAFVSEYDSQGVLPLPHSWAVTTDSIAARLADRLGGSALTLLKSAPLPPGTDRTEAVQLGLVDPYFLQAARGLEQVSYLNLRESSAIADAVLLPGDAPAS